MTGRRDLDEAARRETTALAAAGLSRAPIAVEGVDVLTNDVLSLRRDPRVVAAAQAALSGAGLGAGGSRLLGGDAEEHRLLETAVAAWVHEEAAVSFPTGTAANVGLLTGLLRPEDLVVSDARNHGSLVDGVRLSRARKAIVAASDPAAVEAALGRDRGGGRRFVVVEGVHGMDGDAAPLAGLADVCRRRDALLVVDEAHAAGLLGADGAGAAAAAGVADVVAARVVPCGKALAGAGGVVATSRAVADLLVHRSRAYAYTTALPPAVAAGVRAALDVSVAEPSRRARALALAARLRARLRAAGLRVFDGDGAFVAWLPGDLEATMRAAERLRAAGFAARAVRPPTVPEGTARLRLSTHFALTDAEADRLGATCEAAGRAP